MAPGPPSWFWFICKLCYGGTPSLVSAIPGIPSLAFISGPPPMFTYQTHGFVYLPLFVFLSRNKIPRMTGASDTTSSSEIMNVLQSFIAQQQSQQQPIWNTLSLQMAQNRQMTESLIQMQKVQAQQAQQSQGLSQLPDRKGPESKAPATVSAQDYVEDISEEEQDYEMSHVGSEVDFEDFSNYPELSEPLTLVEKLEKLYDRLPRLQRPPPAAAQAAASVREVPEIAGRVRSLPPPPVILDAFQKFRSSYRKHDGESLVVDDHTGEAVGMVDETEFSNKKQALLTATKKSDLQFQVHNPTYSQFTKLDTDYTKIFRSGSGDSYNITRKQLNNIQTAASYSLDACSHMDALLWGVKECIEVVLWKLKDYDYDTTEEYTNLTAELKEALEYLQSLGFCEEFVVKKNVWVFASIAAFMREAMLSNCRNLDDQFAAQLKVLPFNAGKLYNK